MVKVVLFDLGDTLADGARPFPYVPQALSAIRRFTTASGAPLDTALVSDFTMPAAPAPARVAAIFADYLNELDRLGLRGFFEPVERHVTLSTHAGVTKPDRHVYEVALSRLRSDARLADCLSVTENAGHIAACRDLGMQTLQFGTDFTDWSEFALLVRHQLDPADADNTLLALTPWLAGHTDVRIVDIGGPVSARSARIHVRRSAQGEPLPAVVTFDPTGRVDTMDVDDHGSDPDEREIFERSLREHGQLAEADAEELPPGATHRVETDEKGEPTIVRERFSAT